MQPAADFYIDAVDIYDCSNTVLKSNFDLNVNLICLISL
jgi:hypothetical protein